VVETEGAKAGAVADQEVAARVVSKEEGVARAEQMVAKVATSVAGMAVVEPTVTIRGHICTHAPRARRSSASDWSRAAAV